MNKIFALFFFTLCSFLNHASTPQESFKQLGHYAFRQGLTNERSFNLTLINITMIQPQETIRQAQQYCGKESLAENIYFAYQTGVDQRNEIKYTIIPFAQHEAFQNGLNTNTSAEISEQNIYARLSRMYNEPKDFIENTTNIYLEAANNTNTVSPNRTLTSIIHDQFEKGQKVKTDTFDIVAMMSQRAIEHGLQNQLSQETATKEIYEHFSNTHAASQDCLRRFVTQKLVEAQQRHEAAVGSTADSIIQDSFRQARR